MTTEQIVSSLAVLLISMLGYFLRDAHSRIKEAFKLMDDLQKDLNAQNLTMATDFVRKVELREIEQQLDKFSEVLFGKIDKLTVKVDDKFEQLTTRMDSKIENATSRFDTQIENVSSRFETQIKNFDDHLVKQLSYKQDIREPR